MTEMIDDTGDDAAYSSTSSDAVRSTESGGSDLTTLMKQAFKDNPPIEGNLTPEDYLELWVWSRMHSRPEFLSVMAFGEVLKDPRAPALFTSAMWGMLHQLHHSDDDDDEFAPPGTTNTTPPVH